MIGPDGRDASRALHHGRAHTSSLLRPRLSHPRCRSSVCILTLRVEKGRSGFRAYDNRATIVRLIMTTETRAHTLECQGVRIDPCHVGACANACTQGQDACTYHALSEVLSCCIVFQKDGHKATRTVQLSPDEPGPNLPTSKSAQS